MAKGYWIARIDIRDAERYKDYVSTAAPAFARYGARFLFRGGQFQAVEGAARQRHVIIEFESYQKALECYESSEYQRRPSCAAPPPSPIW